MYIAAKCEAASLSHRHLDEEIGLVDSEESIVALLLSSIVFIFKELHVNLKRNILIDLAESHRAIEERGSMRRRPRRNFAREREDNRRSLQRPQNRSIILI